MEKITFATAFALLFFFTSLYSQDNVFGVRLNPNGILESKEGILGIRPGLAIHLERGHVAKGNYYAVGVTLNDLTPYLFYQRMLRPGKNWNFGPQTSIWFDYWNKQVGFFAGPVFQLNGGTGNFYIGYQHYKKSQIAAGVVLPLNMAKW